MRPSILAWLALLTSASLPHGVAATSFNCAAARPPVERLICSSSSLSVLDDRLAAAYRNPGRGPRRDDQLQWLAARNRCSDEDCIEAAYRRRIAELTAQVDSGLPDPTPPVDTTSAPSSPLATSQADNRRMREVERDTRRREQAEERREEQRRRQQETAERRDVQHRALLAKREEAARQKQQQGRPCWLGCASDLMSIQEPPEAREERLRFEAEQRIRAEEAARRLEEAQRAERLQSGRERAAQRLAVVQALAPEIHSLAIAEREIQQAQALGDPTRGLDEDEFQNHLTALRSGQAELRLRLVARMAEHLTDHAATTEGVAAMKLEGRARLGELVRVGEPTAKEAYERLYNQAVDARMVEIWTAFLAKATSSIATLAQQGYEQFAQMDGLSAEQQRLMLLWPVPVESRPALAQYEAARVATVDGMVERSSPRLVAWIEAMPASRTANQRIEDFANRTFGRALIPDRHAALAQAARAKLAAYNPEGYQRPDIVLALSRRRWSEVSAVGLEDLSYFGTSIGSLDRQCPGLLDQEKRDTALGYALSASRDAVQRIMRGQASSPEEAQRAVLLGLNTLFGQPGCRVNRWGGVVSCTTQDEFASVNQALMTSGAAQSDMSRLVKHGCSSAEVRGYADAAIQFASRRPGTSTPPIPEAIEALNTRLPPP